MKKSTLCLFGGALLGAGLSSPAVADITINNAIGMIGPITYDPYTYTYSCGFAEIDRFNFTVLSDSVVTLDILSNGVFDTWINSQIMLFVNIGGPLWVSNYVGANDNNDYGSDTNGSVSSLDSFLNIFLTAREYTITVGSVYYDIDDAQEGMGVGCVFGPGGGFSPVFYGEYQLDIIGDVVPTPGALALLALGGIVGTRRRR